MITPERKDAGNRNMLTNDILNIGADTKAIPSLATFLYNLKNQVAGGNIYQYVLAGPERINIATSPWGLNNTEIIPANLVYDGVEDESGKPQYNSFGAAFDNNSITHAFNLNTFGVKVTYNTFGEGFAGNKLGSHSSGNTFGSQCVNNDFSAQVTNCSFSGVRGCVAKGTLQASTFGFGLKDSTFTGTNSFLQVGNNCQGLTFINCDARTQLSNDAKLVIPDNTSNVTYIKCILTVDPYGVASKLDKASNLSDVQDKVLSLKNLGILGSDGKIPLALVPGSVDEIQEAATVADLPATGAAKRIYVITSGTDANNEYRWSGTQYVQLNGANGFKGTSDNVSEGTVNLYFTNARTLAATLTGYAKATTSSAIGAATTWLQAIGILEKKADDNATALTNIGNLIPTTATAANKLATADDVARAKAAVKQVDFSAQTLVTVAHNLNRLAAVQVYDATGYLVDTQVKAVDLNTVEVSFSAATTGSVIVF